MVKELLLGDNPFIGVSHLTQKKAREEAKEAVLSSKVKVLEAAVDGGATGFTYSTHKDNLKLLNYLNDHEQDLLNRIGYYILVPYAQYYIGRANIEGTPKIITSRLISILKRRRITETVAALISLSPERFSELFIEAELAPYLELLPRENIKAVLLHEAITELIIAFDLIDMVKYIDRTLRRRLGIGFGLETRNFGRLHKYTLGTGYCPEYLMTPFNPLGYQMAPNKRAVEEGVDDLGTKARIIGINILASGAVSLDEAVKYLASRKDVIYGVTSASIKPHRIHDNFLTLRTSLKTERTSQHERQLRISW